MRMKDTKTERTRQLKTRTTTFQVLNPRSLAVSPRFLVLNFMSQAPVGGQGQWTNGQSGFQGAIPSAVFCFRLLHSSNLSVATTS